MKGFGGDVRGSGGIKSILKLGEWMKGSVDSSGNPLMFQQFFSSLQFYSKS
jgi:hypothetical protein